MARSGRPSKLNQVLRRDAQGRDVTVGEHVIQAVRAGSPAESAARTADIDRATLHRWQKEGARISTDVHEGRRHLPRAGTRDRRLMDFCNGLAIAEAEWEVGSLATLENVSRRRETVETRTTTEDTPTGKVTKVITVRKQLEPDAPTIRWRLAQKYPQRYGRQALELSGPEGGPIPVAVAEVAQAKLAQMAANLAANNGTLEQARADAEQQAEHPTAADPTAMPGAQP